MRYYEDILKTLWKHSEDILIRLCLKPDMWSIAVGWGQGMGLPSSKNPPRFEIFMIVGCRRYSDYALKELLTAELLTAELLTAEFFSGTAHPKRFSP